MELEPRELGLAVEVLISGTELVEAWVLESKLEVGVLI